MKLPTIILLRHGETEWNVEGRYQGQENSPLTPKGKVQAKENALKIKEYLFALDSFKFVSSPLGRARETALIIADTLLIDLNKIEFLEDIKEFNYGKFEGKTKVFCQNEYKEVYEAREANKWSYVIEGGESYVMVTKRLTQWLETLDAHQVVVMVAHEMINRALRGIYCNLEINEMLILRQPNDMVIKLENKAESIIS